MAMITCPECGKQISDKADRCIGCGVPMEEIRAILSMNEVTSDSIQPDITDPEESSEAIMPPLKTAAKLTVVSSTKRIRCLYCSNEYNIEECKCTKCGNPFLTLINNAEDISGILNNKGSKKKEDVEQLPESDNQSDNNTITYEGISFNLPSREWESITIEPGENYNTTPHPFITYQHKYRFHKQYRKYTLVMTIYRVDKLNEKGTAKSDHTNNRRKYLYSRYRKEGIAGIRALDINEIKGLFGKLNKGYSIAQDTFPVIDGVKCYLFEYHHNYSKNRYFGQLLRDCCHLYIPKSDGSGLTVIEFEYTIITEEGNSNPCADEDRNLMEGIIESIKIVR